MPVTYRRTPPPPPPARYHNAQKNKIFMSSSEERRTVDYTMYPCMHGPPELVDPVAEMFHT